MQPAGRTQAALSNSLCRRCVFCVSYCAACADRYVARLTGQMPEDPLQLAVAEQAYFFCEDLFQT